MIGSKSKRRVYNRIKSYNYPRTTPSEHRKSPIGRTRRIRLDLDTPGWNITLELVTTQLDYTVVNPPSKVMSVIVYNTQTERNKVGSRPGRQRFLIETKQNYPLVLNVLLHRHNLTSCLIFFRSILSVWWASLTPQELLVVVSNVVSLTGQFQDPPTVWNERLTIPWNSIVDDIDTPILDTGRGLVGSTVLTGVVGP